MFVAAVGIWSVVAGPLAFDRAPDGGANGRQTDHSPAAAVLGVFGVGRIAVGLRGVGVATGLAEAGIVGTFTAVVPWIVIAVVAKTALDVASDVMNRAAVESGVVAKAELRTIFEQVGRGTLGFADARERLRQGLRDGLLGADDYRAGLRALNDVEALAARAIGSTEFAMAGAHTGSRP